MKKEEIKARIKELEGKRFYLQMADFWTSEDYEYDNKWLEEIIELRKILEEMKEA